MRHTLKNQYVFKKIISILFRMKIQCNKYISTYKMLLKWEYSLLLHNASTSTSMTNWFWKWTKIVCGNFFASIKNCLGHLFIIFNLHWCFAIKIEFLNFNSQVVFLLVGVTKQRTQTKLFKQIVDLIWKVFVLFSVFLFIIFDFGQLIINQEKWLLLI